MKERVNVGLVGLGVIGGSVARVFKEKPDILNKQTSVPLVLKRVADRDKTKAKSPLVEPYSFTTDAQDILQDPEIDIVVELIGGENPAYGFIKGAIQNGKHIVTANKEVMAKHGAELLAMANQHRVGLLYEASVGGGIPLISPLKRNLQVDRISAIRAIINGTTNYILTRMEKEGLEFSTALKEAQSLGYAEADPTDDIEGVDAAYKIAILATVAFHVSVRPQDVHYEGISRTAPQDFRYAKELGYAIKLLAMAKKEDNTVQARVHPAFIPEDMLLAKVDGVFNAVQTEGELSGKVMFYGRGAGPDPTSNVIIGDITQLAQSVALGTPVAPEVALGEDSSIKSMDEIETRYYLRMTVTDQAGVLARITKVLGTHRISVASVIQKETDERFQTAEIVIMTHPAREKAMQQAIKDMEGLEVVKEISNLIRVED